MEKPKKQMSPEVMFVIMMTIVVAGVILFNLFTGEQNPTY